MDMQGLIEEMSVLIAKIKSGEATRGEVEAFAAATAELHERAVVLRYKYYEAKVHNTVVEAVAAVPSTLEARAHSEVEVIASVSEPVVESVADRAAAFEEEMPVVETQGGFDLFEEPAAEPEVVADVLETSDEVIAEKEESFDLFSLDEDEEEEPAFLFDGPTAEIATEPVSEMPTMEDEAATADSDSHLDDETPIHTMRSGVWSAPESEEEPEADLAAEESFTADEEPSVLFANEEPANEEPLVEEMDFSTPETASAPAEPVDLAASYAMHPVYSRLNTDDNSIAGRLMAVRLESLNGAFGFNERMQIVQELFNGSNDLFTQAIQELDNMPSKDAARGKVSKIATIYGWSADNRLALEFVQKVERRYA